MGPKDRSRRLMWAGALAAALLALLVAGAFRAERTARDTEPAASGRGAPARSPPPRADGPPPATSGPVQGDAGEDLEEPAIAAPPSGDGGAYPVDLEHLRALLPDNLYFRLGAPTDDPALLQERADEERRWNDLHGKIQSNTATEEEIRSYYDHRRELSEDYVEFASLVLEEYGDKLPERDQGLYALSIKMHRKRLEEIPRNLEDALARRIAHEKRKQEWIRGGQKD
jgi:hypothetical protein